MEALLRRSRILQRSVAPLVLGTCVWLTLPAQAFAKAVVRFVHAVPGVGQATVTVNDGSGAQQVGKVAFGQSTRWSSVRSGAFRWSLAGGGKTLATGTTTVGNGAYDLVVLEQGSGVRLGVYKAEAGTPGTSLVRVIHAAPELGSPQLTVDGKVAVKSLAYTKATPYVQMTPGMHALGADRPGSSTPVVSMSGMTVQAGKSYSAVVIGTRGQRVRIVTLVDRGAPLVRARRPVSSAAGSGGGSTVVVRTGDSLWSIASRLAGPDASGAAIERRLVSIWDANEERIGTGDPNLVFPGTVLTV